MVSFILWIFITINNKFRKYAHGSDNFEQLTLCLPFTWSLLRSNHILCFFQILFSRLLARDLVRLRAHSFFFVQRFVHLWDSLVALPEALNPSLNSLWPRQSMWLGKPLLHWSPGRPPTGKKLYRDKTLPKLPIAQIHHLQPLPTESWSTQATNI